MKRVVACRSSRLAGEDPARHRLHAETQKALAVPAVQERLATFGVEPMPMTVDEFG
jgi:tripartite-type tricarboxylate transporter receptor subunit TctC